MAEDIRQNFGTDTPVTIALDSLANATSVVSSAVNVGSPGPFTLSLEVKLAGLSASNTGNVDIYAQFSNDNADFSDSGNDLLVGTVGLNGTTGVIKTLSMPVLAQYVKLRAQNNSGDALAAAGNTIRYVPISVDQV